MRRFHRSSRSRAANRLEARFALRLALPAAIAVQVGAAFSLPRFDAPFQILPTRGAPVHVLAVDLDADGHREPQARARNR